MAMVRVIVTVIMTIVDRGGDDDDADAVDNDDEAEHANTYEN